MAFYSYPFESQNTGTPDHPVYDRAITAENERQFNKLRYTNGVFIESALDDDLQVIPGNGMAVKVSKGGCHIEGALAYNDNAVTLSLEAANATLRRIDRVVARFNTSTNVRSIMVYVKTGTNSTNPVAPSLQRESNFWEIGLADITIPAGATSISASNILDTRMDDSLCGRVLPAIPYITQLGSLYEQYQELVDSALSGTVAGQLEARIAAEEAKVQPLDKGGTGKTTRAAAMNNLQYIPFRDLSFLTGNGGGDTTANWVKAGTGLTYISTEGLLENQPMKFGWLYNYTSGSVIVAQQFIGLDGNSPVWYRSGNASGWYAGSKDWVRILDEKTTGVFYEQHFNSIAIPAATSRELASLTLPAGTYVIEGGSSWAIDNRNMYIMAFIRDVTASRDIALNRGVMIAGGGLMPTVVVKFDTNSTIKMYAYWSGGSGTATHNSDYLRAVRIK